MGKFNVLVSSGGRRISLLDCFREALYDLNVPGQVFATDSSVNAPAIHLADRAWQVPRCTDPTFCDVVLDIAVREDVRLIVPTIDGELLPFAYARRTFAANNVFVGISDPATVQICRDKELTHQWLIENGFPTVRQSTADEILSRPELWPLPLIAKPSNGSASKGVRVIRTLDELRIIATLDPGYIVQEIAEGSEYTINVFVDSLGKCVCAVPHQRVEVRSGEVSKAVTVKDPAMMRLAADIAERLPNAFGMLNIQMFRSDSKQLRVIEINARVGGGYPVAHHAGARFTHWLIEEALGRPLSAKFDEWQDDLAMLRFDTQIFRPGASIRNASLAQVEVVAPLVSVGAGPSLRSQRAASKQ